MLCVILNACACITENENKYCIIIIVEIDNMYIRNNRQQIYTYNILNGKSRLAPLVWGSLQLAPNCMHTAMLMDYVTSSSFHCREYHGRSERNRGKIEYHWILVICARGNNG